MLRSFESNSKKVEKKCCVNYLIVRRLPLRRVKKILASAVLLGIVGGISLPASAKPVKPTTQHGGGGPADTEVVPSIALPQNESFEDTTSNVHASGKAAPKGNPATPFVLTTKAPKTRDGPSSTPLPPAVWAGLATLAGAGLFAAARKARLARA